MNTYQRHRRCRRGSDSPGAPVVADAVEVG